MIQLTPQKLIVVLGVGLLGGLTLGFIVAHQSEEQLVLVRHENVAVLKLPPIPPAEPDSLKLIYVDEPLAPRKKGHLP